MNERYWIISNIDKENNINVKNSINQYILSKI